MIRQCMEQVSGRWMADRTAVASRHEPGRFGPRSASVVACIRGASLRGSAGSDRRLSPSIAIRAGCGALPVWLTVATQCKRSPKRVGLLQMHREIHRGLEIALFTDADLLCTA